MDVLLACLHGVAYAALAIALPLPRCRRPAMLLLAAAAVASLVAAGLGPATRELTTAHTFAGFEGASQEVSMRSFPTGTTTAPGWQWALPFAGFALLWAAILKQLGDRMPARPWLVAMAMAWTATAMWLGMQWFAAPACTVQPLGLDRVLFPAGVALALGVARTAKGLPNLFFLIGSGTVLARLPAALWSKVASDHRLGTCLDIHSIRDIVNPLTGLQFDPRLGFDSPEQQFWLIWLEHVIMFPAIYLLSLIGIGFGVYMFHKQAAMAE